jgi:hypothetical protein
VQIVTAVGGGLLLGWLSEAVMPAPIRQPVTVFWVGVVIGSCLLLVLWGIHLVNRDNQRLKECAAELHQINHIYRDALSELLAVDGGSASKTDEKVPDERAEKEMTDEELNELFSFERAVLSKICRKVANIYWRLTGRKCMVTVKLAVKEETESSCFTWARSEPDIYRADFEDENFALLTGENTGFDEALKFRSGGISHFFSDDLWSDRNYRNQREGWQRYYRSTIVVPIRRILDKKEEKTDLIGFLCVDTMSANRLQGEYKVQFLAAFADQMYNFLSLARGKYRI